MVSTRADPAPESFPPRIGCLVPRSERRLRATPHGRDAAVAVVSGGPKRSRTNKNQDCPQTSHCLFHHALAGHQNDSHDTDQHQYLLNLWILSADL
jgi:hypothetical protein